MVEYLITNIYERQNDKTIKQTYNYGNTIEY